MAFQDSFLYLWSDCHCQPNRGWFLWVLCIFACFWRQVYVHIGGFPGSSAGEESACNAGDPGSIPGLGRSSGEGIGYPLQYSWASLVAQMVNNPPTMEESWVGKIPWRRAWQPTPVFLPGESHGLRSLVGYTVHGVTKSRTGLSD